jgi:hypothetical protein
MSEFEKKLIEILGAIRDQLEELDTTNIILDCAWTHSNEILENISANMSSIDATLERLEKNK